MSDQRDHVAHCVSSELLSAYVDGLVDERQRWEIEAHLAACEACYELMMEVVRTQDALPATRAEPYGAIQPQLLNGESFPAKPRSVFGQIEKPAHRIASRSGTDTRRRGFLALAAGSLAAAAAAMLAVRTQPAWWQRLWGNDSDEVARLVEVVGNQRLIEGRLSGGFKYGPLRSPTRSASTGRMDNLALLAAAGRLEEMIEARRSPELVRALAVAQVLLGDYDEAISGLEEVRASSPGAASLHNDLAAAYLARAQAFDRAEDSSRALTEADRALQLDPEAIEALFNRGLALEQLGRREEAAAIWRDVIARDQSDWRQEAERRLRDQESSR